MLNIQTLKDIHKDDDIWVLGSGPSMNFICNSFFENKTTIAVNEVCKYVICNYVVVKDLSQDFEAVINNLSYSIKVIASKHECGNPHQSLNRFNFPHYIFEHTSKIGRDRIPDEWPDVNSIVEFSDKIVVSFSTITSAIHIAAYMGAKNIIICGHDCGTIDGKCTIDGYYDNSKPIPGNMDNYVKWLSNLENHTSIVSGKLKQVYGCNIHSINPFINMNLEGHRFVPSLKGKILQRKLP
jgi:hypothetical protein